MKILIVGGTGFISGALVRLLANAGHRVTCVTRGISGALPAGSLVEAVACDRADTGRLKKILGTRTFDAVFDMVAYTARHSVGAVEVFRGRAGRFIHCSTVSVYMVSNDVQSPITEDQDKRPAMPHFPRNPFGMEYGLRKRECEEALWRAHDEKNFPVTMLRPTFVGGPGDPAGRDFFWIERLLDWGPLLVPGSGDHPFQSVFVDDVASAFARLLEVPKSVGRVYNIAGEEILSLNDYLRTLGRLVGREAELIHVPQEEFDALPFSASHEGDVFPFNVRRTAVFSLDAAKRDLDYASTPISAWMKRTIDWYGAHSTRHSNGYDRRREELRTIAEYKKKTGR